MENDRLKSFISRHRELFDAREPGTHLEERVLRKLQPLRWWHSAGVWRAAAGLLLLLSTYLWMSRPVPFSPAHASNRLQQELQLSEEYYNELMAGKLMLIKNFENAYRHDQISQDVQRLEAMYAVLKEEMLVRPTEKVRDALILNMIVRVGLLDQQLRVLDEMEKQQMQQGTTAL